MSPQLHIVGFSPKYHQNALGYFEVYLKLVNNYIEPAKEPTNELEDTSSYIMDAHEVEFIGRDNHKLRTILLPQDLFIERQ